MNMMEINELEILAEALGDEAEVQQPQGFRIDSIDKLDWAVRKWLRIDREMQQKIDCAKRQIERLQSYIRDVEEKANRDKAGLEAMMEPFVRQQLEGSKSKTFSAPSGKVQIREQQPEITKDDQQLLSYLKSSGYTDFIQTKESPKWGEFKATLREVISEDGIVTYVTSDGEIVPGVIGRTRPGKLIVKGGC